MPYSCILLTAQGTCALVLLVMQATKRNAMCTTFGYKCAGPSDTLKPAGSPHFEMNISVPGNRIISCEFRVKEI
jgi:hypothetical protein